MPVSSSTKAVFRSLDDLVDPLLSDRHTCSVCYGALETCLDPASPVSLHPPSLGWVDFGFSSYPSRAPLTAA